MSEKIFVGDLAPLAELKEKDSLINRISGAITPLPIGINIQILDRNGQYIYVFEIQPSLYKPHQYDTRYYVRLDGQTKPAPHYLIEALMKQITYPNLNGIIKFHNLSFEPHTLAYKLPLTVAIFNFSQLQNEESLSFRILVTGAYFMRGRHMQYNTVKPQFNLNGQQLFYENFANVLHYGTPNTYNDELTIDVHSVKEDNGIVRILLSFGGKKSPAKVSSYTLDFNGDFDLDAPYDLIREVEENVMFSELKQHANRSNEDTLKSFLKRF